MTLAKPQVRGSTIDIANWAIYYYAKVERQIKGFTEYFTQEINLHKKVSTSTLVELAEVVLRNNVFTFGKNTRNSNRN